MSNDNNDIQWYEYHDDSGKPYYYNTITKETTWIAPSSDYIKSNTNTTTTSNTSTSIKKRQRDDDDDDDYGDSTYNTTIAVSNTNNVYGNWDDDDEDFDDEYDHSNTYNNITGTTTKDDTNQETTPIGTPIGTPPTGTPPSGSPIDDDDDYDYNNYNIDDDADNKQQDNNDDMYINDDDDHDNNDEDDTTTTINNEEQRKLKEIKELEDKLNAVDAIVNTDINATIQRLVQLSDDPSVMAKKISNSLSENYVGYAQMTHVLLEWLHIAQEADKATSSSSSSIQNIVIEDQETVAVNELAEIIKEMFNKDKADELIKLFVTSHEASEWFTKLIEDPILRRTLIELYDKNKGSTLLAHSIKMLSSMGYNREIAQIVREVDYIEVFNELLIDLITRVVQSNDDDLQSLAEDLKRMCCHTDFMFAYSHYLLIYIEQLLLLDNTIEADFEAAAQTDESEQDKQRRESLNMMLWGDDDDDDDVEQTVKVQEQSIKSIYDGKKVQSVRHKIRRLREELELTAIWKKRETGSGRLTNVGQFGLKLIGLQKLSTDNNGGQNLTASVWYELLDMLKSNSISTIHVDRLTSYYFKGNSTIEDSSQLQQMTVPVCFLREPQVIHMLIDALIHPSKQLATSSIKIARLLALAYCYDDGSHKDNTDLMYYGFLGSKAKAKSDSSTKDYDSIAKELIELEASLLKIRELCDGIIKMAYSVLSFDKPYKIVELMVNPLVSMCVIRYYHYYYYYY